MLLDFKSQAIIRIPASIIGGVLGVVLAFEGFGVWSLVYMQLAQGFLETVSIWLKEKWRPSFLFDKERFRFHFSFGYKLTLSGIINTIYENIYQVIIGKNFSAAELGYYSRAQAMKQLPVTNISNTLNKVTYPLFSSIQDDDLALKSLYKKLMQQILFWVAPVLVIGGVLGEPLFRYLMTEKWLPAVVYFQILCLEGILYPLHVYNLNILKVKGRSDLFLRLEIIKKVLITGGLVVAIPFGIYGLLWMQLALSLIAFFINTYYSGKMIAYPVGEQLKDIIPILGLAGIVGFWVYLVDFQMPNIINFDIIRLVVGTLLGMGTYILISYLTRFNPLIEFRQLILKR
jgi:O-antigen/teichoic acid export membrane protein